MFLQFFLPIRGVTTTDSMIHNTDKTVATLKAPPASEGVGHWRDSDTHAAERRLSSPALVSYSTHNIWSHIILYFWYWSGWAQI